MAHPLWHVDHKQFKMEQLKEQCTLNDWYRKNGLEWSNSKNGSTCIYLELDNIGEDGKILNAILIDKVMYDYSLQVQRESLHYCIYISSFLILGY